ncbi:hypothetical protein SAMN05216199_2932 [Pedococcus cremeus]|uniref:Uncharacterized protein n=1 Tax=Pedococcus cremeus TaxID=587636 RepID=A0A1H9WHY4_9MICO|nr:hypothetical protein [Pedococcus cremeus]SES33562.1 hypothetical protein SAMN05216199_2932 [Pedococcus cremeus]
MDEDELLDTQWTPEAQQAYEKRAEELIEAIRNHVAANITRTGRQKELGPYFESAETLVTVARAFENAEFNWCGSFPLGLGIEDDLESDDGDEEEVPEGRMLSVFRRWDLNILDDAAVIAAGRAAYLRAWPDDTEEDAALRVQDVEMAAGEIIHADGIDALSSTEGLQAVRGATTILQHDAEDYETFDANPWGVVNDD